MLLERCDFAARATGLPSCVVSNLASVPCRPEIARRLGTAQTAVAIGACGGHLAEVPVDRRGDGSDERVHCPRPSLWVRLTMLDLVRTFMRTSFRPVLSLCVEVSRGVLWLRASPRDRVFLARQGMSLGRGSRECRSGVCPSGVTRALLLPLWKTTFISSVWTTTFRHVIS